MDSNSSQYSEDEVKKYDDMIKNIELNKRRKRNTKNDPGKIVSIQKRRAKNKVAKKSRKTNRQKKK